MRCPVYVFVPLLAAYVLCSPTPAVAKPASRISIEWATANSDRVIAGKVIKVASVDKHDIVTVEIHRTLRGDQESKGDVPRPQLTFVTQKYCSGYAQGWLKDGLPMVFFLVKRQGANNSDGLPKNYEWVLHDNGNGNSAVLLGKTDRVWPGTMDVFTRKFDYLTNSDEIIKYVAEYARSIPTTRIEKSTTVTVPHETSAYRKVFPPEYPGNAFYLRLPIVEAKQPPKGKP
jgi:hypothetical protein